MDQLILYLKPILIFSALMFIAIGMPLKTLAFIYRQQRLPALWISLGLTVVYVASLHYSNQHAYHAYRWLTDILGVLNFSFLISMGFWLLYTISRIANVQHRIRQAVTGHMVIGTIIVTCGLATYNYYKPITVEEHTLVSNKVSREYRFIHLSDIQFGASTRAHMDSVLRKAYSLKPDFIVFTGDLVDFNHYQLDDFSLLANSPVPVYFERGNHEFYHLPEKLLAYLQQFKSVKLLIDDAVRHDELHIIGLDYSRYKSNVANKLPHLIAKDNAFSILLYHEPVEVEVAAASGVDLLLYGHTHGGQIWPFTQVVDRIYTYADGLFTVGESTAYTSDGASLWGPRMRLGSQNEMVLFTIKPQ
jgi:predicted MPP superfamily phosphohydrolase